MFLLSHQWRPPLTIKSHKNNSKFCGMAEMAGDYDENAKTPVWAEAQRDVKGAIPVRWLVAKDVPFTQIDDLEYHGQPVSQLRHANTIPGDIGRRTVQRYFEAPHAKTAVLHPASSSVLPQQQYRPQRHRAWPPPTSPSMLHLPHGNMLASNGQDRGHQSSRMPVQRAEWRGHQRFTYSPPPRNRYASQYSHRAEDLAHLTPSRRR